MAEIRALSALVAHYGSLERHFDRPKPARILVAPAPEPKDGQRLAKAVQPRHDLPHLGRLLDIYV
jgi:hypothetical protein